MKKTALILSLVLAVFVTISACSKKEEAPATGTTGTTTDTPKATTAPAPTAGGVDKVGVAECDEYISKYQKCLNDKIPPAAQDAMKAGFNQTVEQWKKVAATPEGRSGLAMGCKSALDAAKQAMSAYGCEW